MTDTRTPETHPVLNSPYEEPAWHWTLDDRNRAAQPVCPGRRQSAGIISVPDEETPNRADAQDVQDALDLEFNRTINEIRRRVKAWREDDYPGATPASRRLLWHWTDEDRSHKRLFFAQVEALETLIFLTEVDDPDVRKLADDIRNNSGAHNEGLHRLAVKMATGTGKTVVMGMAVCWHALNRLDGGDPQRYQRNFLAITPGLTVRDRLGVLVPGAPENVYDDMNLLPTGDKQALSQVVVKVVNFHRLRRRNRFASWSSDAKKLLASRTDTDATESIAAMFRRELRGMHGLSVHGGSGDERVCVLNDEAHHCYLPGSHTGAAEDKEEDKKAAIWYRALHLLDEEGLLGPVYDFSATPMFIETSARRSARMFPWVVSDFPLMDAIESGMVKIPRVPVLDDADGDQVQWRHLYKASFEGERPRKLDPLDIPLTLAQAIQALYGAYKKTDEQWQWPTPPVFIVVAKTVDDAQALYRYLAGWEAEDEVQHEAACPLFSNTNPENQVRTLLVHSKMEDEDGPGRATKVGKLMKEQADRLRTEDEKEQKGGPDDTEVMRDALNTVGKEGGRGEQVRCVVSVSMLTEGWDTRTVTHILGFRPFGTQLLCEQVTGRALRRVTYDLDAETGLLPAYTAEVLGVPFTFMSAAEVDGEAPPPPVVYDVHTLPARAEQRILLPMLEGYIPSSTFIGVSFNPDLAWPPTRAATEAKLEGVADRGVVLRTEVDPTMRRQTLITHVAAKLVERIVRDWGVFVGDDAERHPRRTALFRSAYAVVQQWFQHHEIYGDDLLWLTSRPMRKHVADAVFAGCAPEVPPEERLWHAHWQHPKFLDTAEVDFATSLKDKYPAAEGENTVRSELNRAACHSEFEAHVAELLDSEQMAQTTQTKGQIGVQAWVRNFRLGWDVPYIWQGRRRRYEPDFVARVGGGYGDPWAVHLIVEVKGQPDPVSETKKRAVLERWIPAVESSSETPEWLRHWQFVELDNRMLARTELRAAVTEAAERSVAVHRALELRVS